MLLQQQRVVKCNSSASSENNHEYDFSGSDDFQGFCDE
jgi:hypothetical protein